MGPLMGDSVQWGLMQTILKGIPEHPPCEDMSEEHWIILPTTSGYMVEDQTADVIVPAQHERLNDRSFDFNSGSLFTLRSLIFEHTILANQKFGLVVVSKVI